MNANVIADEATCIAREVTEETLGEQARVLEGQCERHGYKLDASLPSRAVT